MFIELIFLLIFLLIELIFLHFPAEVLHCEEPALTIDHITFDEIPPFDKSDLEWKLLNLSYNFIHAVHDNPFVNLSVGMNE